jgi:cytochrome P450
MAAQDGKTAEWVEYLLAYLPYVLPLTFSFAYVSYQLFLSPLSFIPGALSARLSRLWLLRQSRSGNLHRTMISLHARHGKLVRTGPNEVSVSDLTAVKKIYSAGTKFRKSDWYSVWQGRRQFDLFPERDEGVHGRQRRLVSGMYSMGNISQYQGRVDEAIDVFVKEIEKRIGTVMDLGNWLQLFAFGASRTAEYG